MYFLGIENGPVRTRTVVLNLETATLEAESEQAYGQIKGLPEGHCEQDPSLWIQAVDYTVRDCLSQIGQARSRVAGLGVSGQARGLVVLDRESRIVRPAKLAADRSAERQCEEMNRAFGGAPGLIELTGNPMRSSFMAPRLRWLKQNEPYHFQRVASCLSPHDFINFWLGGVKRSEYGDASETGMLDVRSRTWCRALADFVDPSIEEALPPVKSSREAVGVLRGELCRVWGLRDEVLLSAGGADEMMTMLGAGAVNSGAVAISTETGSICGVSDSPVIDPCGEISGYCDATDRWMPLARNYRAAEAAKLVQQHYAWNADQLEGALRDGEPGAGGILFFPGRDESPAKSALSGIQMGNYTAENVVRAAMESLAMEFGRGLRRMVELGFDAKDVRLSGPASRFPSWRQLLSDVLGLPVRSAKPNSCSALGAALQAAVTFFEQTGENLTYDELTSYAALPEKKSLCEPNEKRHHFYEGLLERYEAHADSLLAEEIH